MQEKGQTQTIIALLGALFVCFVGFAVSGCSNDAPKDLDAQKAAVTGTSAPPEVQKQIMAGLAKQQNTAQQAAAQSQAKAVQAAQQKK